MNIKDFQDSLEYLFKANVTPFVWGHAGIGKTTSIKQYAEERGWHFFPMYLGTQSDLGDILGLADFKRDAAGNPVATVFSPPSWLQETIEYCNNNPNSGAIIFLDEFNRARRDVLNGMFSLALDKTFHTVKLPKNCHVIAAGNPPTDEYYVTDVNEAALMARFVHIKLEPTIEEWVRFAQNTGIDDSLIGFIKEQPKLLEDARSEFQLPVKVDRRAFERLNRLMVLKTPQHLLTQLMQGIVGTERTVAYHRYLENRDKPLTLDEILKGERFDQLRMWSSPENVQASMVGGSCDAYVEAFEKRDNDLFTDEECVNLMEFLRIIPKDLFFAVQQRLAKIRQSGKVRKLACWVKFTSDEKYVKEITEMLERAMGVKQ